MKRPLVDPTDDGIRPAGVPYKCVYCSQLVGQPHKRDCVIVKKVVRVRWTVDVDIEVPHSWSREVIEEDNSVGQNVWDVVFAGEYDPVGFEFVGIVDETPRREVRVGLENLTDQQCWIVWCAIEPDPEAQNKPTREMCIDYIRKWLGAAPPIKPFRTWLWSCGKKTTLT
jgi:hypothetical protein